MANNVGRGHDANSPSKSLHACHAVLPTLPVADAAREKLGFDYFLGGSDRAVSQQSLGTTPTLRPSASPFPVAQVKLDKVFALVTPCMCVQIIRGLWSKVQ
jgi:hypothetical protein